MAENAMEKLIALVPAYCPEQSMIESVRELSGIFPAVIVVDDGCSEEYAPIFDAVREFPGVTILVHEQNKGKGRALKTGFAYALEHYPDALGVVTLDADGQHTVKDTIACCEEFLKQPKSIVFGCRDFTSDSKIPPRSRFGNRLTSRLLKFFCDISLSDTQTGLRVHGMSYLPKLLEVEGDRYEYEMNVIFAVKDLDVPIVEVPIEVIYLDDNASSHFNPIKDSMKIYKVFFKFMLSSFGSAILDFLIYSLLTVLLVGGSVPEFVRIHYIGVSTATARICSGIFNYNINRLLFKTKTKVKSSGPKYLVVWLVQMALSALLVKTLVQQLGWNDKLSKIPVDTILFFISYKVQQLWVFRKEKAGEEE